MSKNEEEAKKALACLEVASKYLQNSGGCVNSSNTNLTITHQPHLFKAAELWNSFTHDQLLRPQPCNLTYEITGNSKDEHAVHPTETLSSHYNYNTHNCGCEYNGSGLESTCHYDVGFTHEVSQNYNYADPDSSDASNNTFAYTSANYHYADSSPQLDVPEVVDEGVPMEEAWCGYEQFNSTWRSDPTSGEGRVMHSYATEQVQDAEIETQQDVTYDNNAACLVNQAASVWSSSQPPSSNRSSSGTAEPVQDQAVDHAVIEGLLDRCNKIITSVQAQLQSDNSVIKESLVSLLRSLELQQKLLAKKKRSFVARPEPALVPGKKTPPSGALAAQRPSNTTQDNSVTVPQAHSDQPAYKDDAPDSAAAAVATMRSLPSCSEGLQGVVGMEDVKHVLQEAFVWPLQFPQLFQGQSLQTWSRLLLYGPPGTGKTRLARALAEELRCPLYTVAPSAVLSSWLGSSEKIIRELFRRARSEPGPVVVFIDEMDALCRTRSLTEDDCTRRIKTELLVHMDNNRSNNSRVRAPDFKSRPHEHDFCSSQRTRKNDLPNYNSPFIRPGYVSNNCQVCPATNCNCHNFSLSKNASADCPQPLNMNQSSRNSYINSSSGNIRASNFAKNLRHRQDSVSDDDVFQMSDEPQDGITRSSCSHGRDCEMDTRYGDGYDADTNQMFIIAATNCPWDIDPAFLRRFQKRCYVALPDSSARRALLKAALSGCRTDIDTNSWDDVLAATEGFSGADLTTVATAAAFRPIRELHSSRYWQFAEGNMIMPCSSDTLGAMQFTLDMLPRDRVTVRPVRAVDLVAATNTTSRSVPAELLQRYQHFTTL
ncbi:ATPase AAA-type core [Trinorchestia longiramus]|nr:ATPase AAA-type core [Trinorchestia longiramus]